MEKVTVFFETGSYSVAQAGFKLAILRPQPPKNWDYKLELPCSISKIILGRRGGSVVKSRCCSSRRPEFSPQYLPTLGS